MQGGPTLLLLLGLRPRCIIEDGWAASDTLLTFISDTRVFIPGGVSHALDIRLMQEGKVLVIDGSQRIHRSSRGRGNAGGRVDDGQGHGHGQGHGLDAVADHPGHSHLHGRLLGSLSPIPKFEQVIGEVVAAAAAARGGSGAVGVVVGAVGYDKGLVAVSDLAPGMLRELHERVLEAL